MTKDYAIGRIEKEGYIIYNLGKNIKAYKNGKSHTGKVSKVYLEIFNYR